MKAKHSVWKNKLAKTMFLMTVVLIAALFIGGAASAAIRPQETKTQNNIPVIALDEDNKTYPLRVDGLAPKTATPGSPSQQGPSLDRGYFYAYNAYDPSGGTPEGPITFDVPGDITGLAAGIFPNFAAGADFDADGNWYAVDYGGGIYLIDPDTGAQTLIAGSVAMNGLCYDDSTATWYGSGGGNLLTVDILTGTSVIVGSHGTTNTIIGLACDLDGNMYAYDVLFTGMSTLFSVNKATGACTAIGSMGVGCLYAQDPGYDRDEDTLYIAAYFNTGAPSALLTCDTATGATTPVGNFEGGMEVDGLAIPYEGVIFEHNIGIVSIVEPASQNAAPITPIVKVKNKGNNTEYNVNVQLEIGAEVITGTVEGFEANNGSYIHAPKLPQPDAWQWGAPTSGPGAAHNGNNVWATNLAGAYPPSMWCYLVTPTIVVPSGAVFNFWHWYYFENNYDGGNIKISNDSGVTWTLITPEGGYPGSMPYNPFMTGQSAFNGQSGGWKQANFDLSAYVGQSVQFMFETASDSSVQYAGWYIDDVGFTITSWQNEYNQTVTIPVINIEETLEVTFPQWSPAGLNTVENVNVNYNAEATNLFADNKTQDDYKSKLFSLHYGYFHDVAVMEIVSPQNGLAQTQTPEVVIENHGQNAENVNVQMTIGKALYTTLLEQDFSGGVPPAGWGTTHPSNWISSSTNYAGGTAPEAEFAWSPSSVGEHLLYTAAINTTGYTALLLKFKEYVNDYNGDYNLKIVTSTDLTTWTDAYVRAGGPYGPTTTEVALTAANGVGSATLYIAWDMSGNSFNINYWYIDDVWLGIINMVQEYDETVIVDIAAGETLNVTLPDWTPADIPFAESIDYLIDVEATLNGLVPVVTEEFNSFTPGYYTLPPTWTHIPMNLLKTWYISSERTYCYEGGVTGTQYEQLITPTINTVGQASVTMQYYRYFYKITGSDTMVEVYGSTDGGATWPIVIKTYAATASAATEVFDISAWAANQPNVKVKFVFMSSNDTYTSSYYYMDNFFVYTAAPASAQNFDGTWGPTGSNPPAGWNITTNEPEPVTWDNNNWHRYLNTGTDYCARIYYSPVRAQDDSIISNVINCAALSTVTLMFDSRLYCYAGYTYEVLGSIDGGATWPYTIASYTVTHSSWTTWIYDISSWAAGQSNVRIRFHYVDYDGLYWYINNFFVGTLTSYVFEDFNDYVPASWGPLGWQTTHTNWAVSNTNYAGGTAPEARFYYSPSSTDVFRLYTGPIDTSAYTELTLKFKEFVNDYNGLYTLKVQTSTDGITWMDAYVRPGGPYGPATTTIQLDAADGVGSSTFRFAYVLDGNSFNINYWYVDDVNLLKIDVVADGYPNDNVLGKIITLSYEHDVGVVAITEPHQSAPPKDEGWLQYDNGVYANAFGSTTGHIYGANRFTIDELTPYVGWQLDMIRWKHYGAVAFSGTVHIFAAGTSSAPGAEITSEPFSITGDDWFEVPLTSPVTLGTDDIWLCVEGTHLTGEYPLECSAPGISLKTAFFSSDGATWYDLPGLGYDVAFEIRGHVTSGAPPGGNWLPGTYPVEGLIQNLGVTYSESGIPVNAQITNDTGVVVYDETVTVAGPLAPGDIAVATFPTITIPSEPAAEGDYKLTMKTVLVGDDHPNNDKQTKTWIIQIPDTTPPTTTADVTGTMGLNDWYVSNVQVTLSATDGKWPLGVNHTYYKIDDGAWEEYLQPVIVDTDGEHTVYYYSDDKAIPPNVEPEKFVEFKMDKTAPVFTDYTFTPQNALKTKWLCVATVSDATSGLDYVEFYVDDALIGTVEAPGPYEFEFQGKPDNNSQALAYDLAGNSALSPIAQYVELNYQTQPTPQLLLQKWL